MKKLLVAGIAAAALYSAPALAAPPAGVFNWSGFYIGVNGGGMDFKTKGGSFINAPGFFWNTAHKETGIGGIHGGYQAQWGNLVVGIEGAWEAALGGGFSSTNGGGAGAPCGFVVIATGDFCQARINDILSVGPRVGFAMGQWMLYGTGGYARAEIESRGFAPVAGPGAFSPASNHHDGWYWGGGLEMLVINGFVIGAEYKHFDFKSAVHCVSPSVCTNVNDRSMKAEADAVLLRLTIKQ